MVSTDYSAFSNEQLLSKLIGVRQSRRAYRGKLQPLFSTRGDGRAPTKCLVAKELLKRALSEEMQNECALTSPGAVRDYLKLLLAEREYEAFVCLWLNAQHCVTKAEEMFRGTLTQTSVYPREVVKAALINNAAAVIFAHNHPSGIAQPSHADELLTRNLKEALALVDVKVLDHFIIAGSATVSFAERGLL